MVVKITSTKNGPYLVSGGTAVFSSDGALVVENKPCALCRCGHSKNKPLCDGAHVTSNWKE